MAKAAPKLFINYRRTINGTGERSRTQIHARLLYSKLIQRFGEKQIFLDQRSIEEGAKWPDEIRRRLSEASVMLVLIGPEWLTAQGQYGQRRLDEEHDWVRQEIEISLQSKPRGQIIPILESAGLQMPPAKALPKSISDLSDIQVSRLRLETLEDDFEAFAKVLVETHGVEPVKKRGARRAADPTLYLDYVQRQYGHIDIKGILRQTTEAQRSFPIDDLYISLTYTTAQREAALVDGSDQSKNVKSNKSTPISGGPSRIKRKAVSGGPAESNSVALTEALSHSRLLVMGDPGSGKTTFLHKIACQTAQKYLEPRRSKATSKRKQAAELPLLIKIGAFCDFLQQETGKRGRPSAKAPTWIEHYLAEESRANHWGLTQSDFAHWLGAKQGSGTLLLLDGLDEAPDESVRKRVQAIIQEFAAIAQKQYPAVRIVVTSRPLEMTGKIDLTGFELARIDPLNQTAIATFLSKWCRALHPESVARANEHKQQLQADLNSRPEIRRLAQTPVMLTALAVVQTNTGRMPEQRAKLYDSVIFWLDRARESARRQRTPNMPSAEPVLRDLALGMQAHPQGFRKQVTRREAAELVAHHFGPAEADASLAAAERFLQYEQLDGGIVVERQRKLEFWHRSFQEFLAASAIAGKSDVNQDKLLFAQPDRIYQPEWREVMRLLGGVLHDAGNGSDRVDRLLTAILEKLEKKPSLDAAARCVGLIGEMLRDLVNPPHPAPGGRYARLRDEVTGIFDPARASQVAVKDRIAAADALGQVRRARAPRTSDDYWVPIAGGTYEIGSSPDKKHRLYDADRYDWELTPRQVTLPPFQIARDPVTVGEFEEFLDDGGYSQRKYWEAGGYGLYGTAPENWEEQLRYPARPVGAVSWHVAMAFCAWAEHALPMEEQWEASARGKEGRRYPWGGESPNSQRLNSKGEIGHPTPPGIFPLGSTPNPDGICDLAGNVWEWCRNDPTGSAENADVPTGVSRVSRGGSWGSHARNVRCAVRNRDPADPGRHLGFRLVRVQES
jgi:formylglycine-generating enzyme required for sulfatase activity